MKKGWRKGHYLHHVNEVEKELLGVLLPIGGKLRVTPSHEGFEHAGRYPNLVPLEGNRKC